MASGLVEIIKLAASEANEAGKPINLVYGTVLTEEPKLSIKITEQITLNDKQLIVPERLTDHVIEMTVDHFTENDAFMNGSHTHSCPDGGTDGGNLNTTHKHAYKGRKKWLWHNKLLTGQKVILLRVQGGQKYFVLDRMEGGFTL